jgi:hypothetical protein
MSVREASSGLMHLVQGMYHDVTDIKTVEISEEFLNMNFIRHLMVGTGDASTKNERVHALHENHAKYRFDGTGYRGDSRISEYGAMRYPTSPRNHMIVNIERFVIRAVFALYPGLSRKTIWAIINGITKNCRNKQEIEFVNKKASARRKNEASVIRAAFQEHRAVSGLVNPTEQGSDMIKDEERCYHLVLRYFVFLNRELERKAEKEACREKMKSGRDGRLS